MIYFHTGRSPLSVEIPAAPLAAGRKDNPLTKLPGHYAVGHSDVQAGKQAAAKGVFAEYDYISSLHHHQRRNVLRQKLRQKGLPHQNWRWYRQ